MPRTRTTISPIKDVLAGGALDAPKVVRALEQFGEFRGVPAKPKQAASQWIPRSWTTGIYVLDTGDGYAYVGQSTEVHARINAHRKTWPALRAVGFLKLRASELDTVERDIARALDASGQPLWNRTLIDVLRVASSLDECFSRDLHDLWLRDLAWNDWSGHRVTDDALRYRYQAAFDEFNNTVHAAPITESVGRFVALTIPAPIRTEATYWSVTCAKPEKDGVFVRINVGHQATLDAYPSQREADRTYCLWIPQVLAEKTLGAQFRDGRGQLGTVRLAGIGKSCRFFYSRLKAAGPDQVGLVVTGDDVFKSLLGSAEFIREMRRLHLGLMQRGKNLNKTSHCLALADRVLTVGAPTERSVAPTVTAMSPSGQTNTPTPQRGKDQKIELHRASQSSRAVTEIEQRVKACLPVGAAGLVAVKRLRDSIELAKKCAPGRWGLSVRDGFLRLNVGMIEVITVEPAGVRLLVLSPKIPAALRSDSGLGIRESSPDPNRGVYTSVYQSAVIAMPAAHLQFGSILLEDLAGAHRELVNRAASTRINPMTRKAHVQAAVDFLEAMTLSV